MKTKTETKHTQEERNEKVLVIRDGVWVRMADGVTSFASNDPIGKRLDVAIVDQEDAIKMAQAVLAYYGVA